MEEKPELIIMLSIPNTMKHSDPSLVRLNDPTASIRLGDPSLPNQPSIRYTADGRLFYDDGLSQEKMLIYLIL